MALYSGKSYFKSLYTGGFLFGELNASYSSIMTKCYSETKTKSWQFLVNSAIRKFVVKYIHGRRKHLKSGGGQVLKGAHYHAHFGFQRGTFA